MIYYLPLEHIDRRYTSHLDRDITQHLTKNNIEFIRIYPQTNDCEIKAGSFLDAPITIEFKSKQIATLANYYHKNIVKDNDIIFCSDLWMPGIESVAYLNYFCNKKVKLQGVIHAGSFTDTDFVREIERTFHLFEDMIFDIAEKIFVGSNFIKNDITKKRIVNENKIIVTGLPVNYQDLDKYQNTKKENIVIFNGRNVDEKQPWLFEELKRKLGEKAEFINTLKLNLSKNEYYKLLSKSKVVVSYALQENFGFGIAEAVYLGCHPVLPNRLVYPELYPKENLYENFEQSVTMVEQFLSKETIKHSLLKCNIGEWF